MANAFFLRATIYYNYCLNLDLGFRTWTRDGKTSTGQNSGFRSQCQTCNSVQGWGWGGDRVVMASAPRGVNSA